jgi:hypothetical protein
VAGIRRRQPGGAGGWIEAPAAQLGVVDRLHGLQLQAVDGQLRFVVRDDFWILASQFV